MNEVWVLQVSVLGNRSEADIRTMEVRGGFEDVEKMIDRIWKEGIQVDRGDDFIYYPPHSVAYVKVIKPVRR